MIVAGIVALVAGLVSTRLLENQETVKQSTAIAFENPLMKISETRDYWLQEINSLGAEAAYDKFKKTYAEKNFGIQHTLAHLMGELLYETQGIKGLAVCDSNFAFGCYHSFFGKVLSEKGLSIIPELDKVCVNKFGPLGTGCQHGIGHGLREFMGPDKVVDALEACTLTTQLKELFGCTSGVFMENNVPIVMSDTESPRTEPRRLDPKNPYEPCNTIVPKKFRKSCYFEMPQWWNQVYHFNFAKVGELCSGIVDKEESKSCYLGAGGVAAPSSQYNVEETIKRCDLMPTEEGVFLCRSGASWGFFSEPSVRNLSPQVCKGLREEEMEHKCAKESDLIGNGERLKIQ